MQLVDFMHGRLQVEGHLGGVNANGQMVHDDCARVVGNGKDVGLVRLGGEHVQVGHEEEALVFVLQGKAMAKAAHVVAQVQFACGAVAGEDTFFVRHV